MNYSKTCAILVNYNGKEDTVECIKSLLASECSVTIKVVENGSNENDAEFIKDNCPMVDVISLTENLGFSGGNNIGIKKAFDEGYDYFLILNNDTVVDSKMLGLLLQYVDKQTVTVPTICYYDKPDQIWYAGGWIDRNNGGGYHIGQNELIKTIDKGNRDVSFATGCCLLLHRDIIEKIGLFDEIYFMYYEDLDYCVRLNQAGIRILYVPEAKLFHKVSSSTGGINSSLAVYFTTRNRLICLDKNRSYFTWIAFPAALISRVIRMVQNFARKDKKYKIYYSGISDFFRYKMNRPMKGYKKIV